MSMLFILCTRILLLWLLLLVEKFHFTIGAFSAQPIPSTSSYSCSSERKYEQQQDSLSIEILLDTDHYLVINKPAGVSHHNDPDDGSEGILNTVRTQLGPTYPNRLYGVHRLDRVTSGILVLAKDAATASQLGLAFANGKVVKYYVGMSRHKATQKKQGWIRGHMFRGRRKSWYLRRQNTKDKLHDTNYAQTRFFAAGLGHLADETNPIRTLILFRPYTGKTHQLRVAAKSVGLPLLGDPIYSDGSCCGSHTVSRTYLHATGLHIPSSDMIGVDPLTVWCPPPFEDAWDDEESRTGFRDVCQSLVRKHCDCPALLELMEK